VATTLGATGVTAFSVEEDISELWSLESDLRLLDVAVHDGHVWYPAIADGVGDDGAGRGLIGIPLDRQGLTEFARSRTTRDFTEDDSEIYLQDPCPAV
jgi:hypothetical protein